MFRVAVLALLVSLAAASTLEDLKRLVGSKFNEIDENDIKLYKKCDNLEKFDSRLLGWWKGRSQVSADQYLKIYDYHYIKSDGTGVLNKINSDDHSKIQSDKPARMWCKKNPNGIDKSVKVQYGPTEYGQIICINLQVPSGDGRSVQIQVNQVLFTDPRVPQRFPDDLDCLNYPYTSKFNSYTVWADQLSNPSSEDWTRTKQLNPDSDWDVNEKKQTQLLQFLKLLSE